MAEDALVDQIVAGKYRVTKMVGRGGMGSVWEGVHLTLGTRVAIKFIDSEHASSKEAQGRFVNEARAAAKLRSKHVVQVYDQGISEDGKPYIVMEFLAGEPLDRRLERLGALSLQETATIVGQICRALSRAHEAGIVHRDLKPENVFIIHDEEDGRDVVKVVDFGIAKFTDSTLGMSSATRTGSVLGTPYYMSPEQARGLRSVDHRADLWSIGVIAYRCVAGRLPFEGEAIGDLLVKICTSPLPVPSQLVPGLPPAFDTWFARALGREPAERFQSAQELADGLAAAAGLASARAPMPSIDASAAYPAQTPWGPGVPTPSYESAVNQQPAALTGAPITTHSQTLPSGSSGKGLLFAALGGALLIGVIGAVLVVRFALGTGSAGPEPGVAVSSAPSSAPVTDTVERPEVSPSVEAPAPDAASAEQPEQEPKVEAALKPPPSTPKTPSVAPSAAPAKTPVGRPKPKDPNDVLGY